MRVKNKVGFITVQEAKKYLKVEHILDDQYITDLIEISKEQADSFLNNDFLEEVEGEWVDIPIPFSIKLACLKMIASWFETRSDDQTSVNAGGVTVQLGDMPWDSARLLYPYRRLPGL